VRGGKKKMASLATIMNRFVGVGELAEARPAVWTRADSCRLRPIANEDVYLFVKRIDNSSVVRAADPAARRTRSRSVVTGFVAAMLVIAGLVPAAYNTMAGFSLQNLRQEQDKLKQQRAALALEEAKLLSPERLEILAKSLHMMEPVPQQVQYLDGKMQRDAKVVLPVPGAEVSAH
jgi:cell division protein FtsL